MPTQIALKIPDELADRVRAAASAARRSANAEILYRVEAALDAEAALLSSIDSLPGWLRRNTRAQLELITSMLGQGMISEDVAMAARAQVTGNLHLRVKQPGGEAAVTT